MVRLQEYRAGRLLTGELKGKCIKILQDFVRDFQDVCSAFISPNEHNAHIPFQRRAAVTEDDIKAFMDGSRKIEPIFGKSKTAATQSA